MFILYSMVAFLFFLHCSDSEGDPILGGLQVPDDLVNIVDPAAALAATNSYRVRSDIDCGVEKFEAAPELKWDEGLSVIALAHSYDQSYNEEMSHSGSDGSKPHERLKRGGLSLVRRYSGENVAVGFNDVVSVSEGWIKSPGHCKNVMKKEFAYVAIARVGAYWTQLFLSAEEE